MKNFKNVIAIFLGLLTLLQSCAAYNGNYSLKTAVDNGNKVRIKFQNNEFLLYNGNRYKYNRINDNHAWNIIIYDENSLTGLSEIQDSTSNALNKIIQIDDNYFGFNDYENRSSWVTIAPSEIIEVSKTKKQNFKKLVYQEGNYWGVDAIDTNLVPIYENQVKKVSEYDPVMSVLGTIVVTPLVIALVIAAAVTEDDW